MLGAGLLWAVIGSTRVLHPIRLLLPLVPSDVGLPWEPIRLSAADGTALSAWVIRHPQPAGVLLLFHGFGSSKAEWLDVAAALHRGGCFSLLMLDFRGHGHSGGKTASFGFQELQEVRAALDFLAADPGLKGLPVGCWGVSMGGSIALLAAARFAEILGVVADSTYAEFGKAVARAQWLTYHIPRVPLGQMVLRAVELRLGCRASQLDPVRAVGLIAPRSLFVIHGGRDATIPMEEAQSLYQAAHEPKEWWLIPEAEHATGYFDRTDEYVRRVKEFFQHAFLRAS